MSRHELSDRLSRIPTAWTLLQQAHGDSAPQVRAARQLLLERYAPAVRRYLGRLVRHAEDADEIAQEFALSLVKGEFHQANPERGRFRDYVKSALFHLVARYYRKQERSRAFLLDDAILNSLPAVPADLDRQFDLTWRETLMTRTLNALEQVRANYHTVLTFRLDHEDLSAEQAAAQLSQLLGKEITPESFRQTLHRARERFAALLVDEVARSLHQPTAERVEEELRCLGLLEHCRVYLERSE